MKSLARGKDNELITRMVKHLIQSTQGSQFETYLDEDGIKDIAEVIKTDVELFSKDE